MNLTFADVKTGARYDHNYLALPAVMTGKCLLVTPEIVVSDLLRGGVLHVVPGSRTGSGMQYRPMPSTAATTLKSLGLFAGGSSVFTKWPPSSKPLDVA